MPAPYTNPSVLVNADGSAITTIAGEVDIINPQSVAGVKTFTSPVVFAAHATATGTAPGVVPGANNGTAPPAPTDVNANDTRGVILFGSGSTPAAGAQVAVTFAAAFTVAPVVTLTPGNAATQPLGLFVSAVSTSGFTVSSVSAPTASQAATVYSVAFQATG